MILNSKYVVFFLLMCSLLIGLIMIGYNDQMVLLIIIVMMIIALLLASQEKEDISLEKAMELGEDFIKRRQNMMPPRVEKGEVRSLTDAETKNIVYPVAKEKWEIDPYKHLVMIAVNDGVDDNIYALGISFKGTLLGVRPLKVSKTAAELEPELKEVKAVPKEIEKKIEEVETG